MNLDLIANSKFFAILAFQRNWGCGYNIKRRCHALVVCNTLRIETLDYPLDHLGNLYNFLLNYFIIFDDVEIGIGGNKCNFVYLIIFEEPV